MINDLSIPSIHDILPYIVDLPKGLSPSFKWSKGRTNVTIVLGIPTVKRDKQSYLQVYYSPSEFGINNCKFNIRCNFEH